MRKGRVIPSLFLIVESEFLLHAFLLQVLQELGELRVVQFTATFAKIQTHELAVKVEGDLRVTEETGRDYLSEIICNSQR